MITVRWPFPRMMTARRRMVLALLITLSITLVLTSISMYLYVRSGTAGLDLSRPGLSKERGSIQKEKTFDFASTGTLTKTDFSNFKKLYDEQRSVLRSAGSFDPDVLTDASLGLVIPEAAAPVEQ